jgi:uncharacterized protein YutE (UPF0331/DUF86 family)
MVDMGLINRLLLNLRGFRQDLREFESLKLDAFRTDVRTQRYAERTLHVAIECCMDICHHIISDQQWREPDSYADAFNVLSEHGVLTAEAAARYRLMAQFRNKLVHYYEKIEPEQVFSIARSRAEDFTDFAAFVETWLASLSNGETIKTSDGTPVQ